MGEEPADSLGLHLAGLYDVGVEATGDRGCEALEATCGVRGAAGRGQGAGAILYIQPLRGEEEVW